MRFWTAPGDDGELQTNWAPDEVASRLRDRAKFYITGISEKSAFHFGERIKKIEPKKVPI